MIDDAANALEHLDPRIAEVLAGVFRPELLQKGHGHVAEEAARRPVFGGCSFLFHISSPSFPRSILYSPTSRAWAKGRPWRWAGRYAAAACRPRPPARRLS